MCDKQGVVEYRGVVSIDQGFVFLTSVVSNYLGGVE